MVEISLHRKCIFLKFYNNGCWWTDDTLKTKCILCLQTEVELNLESLDFFCSTFHLKLFLSHLWFWNGTDLTITGVRVAKSLLCVQADADIPSIGRGRAGACARSLIVPTSTGHRTLRPRWPARPSAVNCTDQTRTNKYNIQRQTQNNQARRGTQSSKHQISRRKCSANKKDGAEDANTMYRTQT